ncbi:MAG: efflux transporter outer membrane subunit [Desulfobacula sp.]|nr:efflux transporter outer membrane subunit [Desulfobacula sp.]
MMKNSQNSFIPFFWLMIVMSLICCLSGCSMFNSPKREVSPISLPEKFSLYTENDSMPVQWWKYFDNAELERLMNIAVADNFNIRTAAARLAQARAQVKKIDADLYPALEAQADAAHKRSRMKEKNKGSKTVAAEEYALGLAAGYEIDLWGRLAALKNTEAYEAIAAREDLEAAAVTISAEVAGTWIDIIAVRNEIAILDKQIETNGNLLKLQQIRMENGLTSALDVSQQMENVAAIRAEMPLLLSRERIALNALVLLLGRATSDDILISKSELPELIPLPDTGIPADLLARRPDVRAAGLRLNSADWQIATARANRLPSLNIMATASFSSSSMDLLFSNWLTSLAAGLTAPLFDAGKRLAEVERTRAVAEERLAQYGETVARAVREVEDGLANESNQRQYLMLLEKQISAARLAMQEARLRYLSGSSAFLNYLVEIQNVQRLDRRIISVKAELIKFRIGLYRALCGGWTDQMIKNDI